MPVESQKRQLQGAAREAQNISTHNDGVKITIDQGKAYRIPYVWCLTNTCIAADLADPALLKEMESGQKLLLEVVDSSVLTVSTSLSLNQFATVRQGIPAQTFEQAIDE